MPDAAHAAWKIQAQTPRTKADLAGNVADGYDITFLTGGGHAGTVFVPMSRYTVDNVAAAIQAQADVIDAVGQLSSDGAGA